jgi:hypothetical protein
MCHPAGLNGGCTAAHYEFVIVLSDSRKAGLPKLCLAHFCREVDCVEERYNVREALFVMTRSFAQRRLKRSGRGDSRIAGLPAEPLDIGPEARNLDLSVSVREGPQYMNFAGIDVVSIRLVVVCAELGSLSAAALHANISLSCASHRLSTVENRFGTRFFVRDHRGLHLTRSGVIFVDHANAVLDSLRRMRDQLAASECAVEIVGPDVINAPPVSDGKRSVSD